MSSTGDTAPEQADEAVGAAAGLTGYALAIRIDYSAYAGREANGENRHYHRRNLSDPGSCDVPKGRTITLEEWRRQQEQS